MRKMCSESSANAVEASSKRTSWKTLPMKASLKISVSTLDLLYPLDSVKITTGIFDTEYKEKDDPHSV